MKLEESIEKTKKFFCKSLKDLKNLYFAGYKRLTKSRSCNPFSCSSINSKNGQADRYYADLCDNWQCELDKAIKRKNNDNMAWKEPNKEEAASNGGSMKLATSPTKKTQGEEKGKKNETTYHSRKSEDQCVNGGYPLARKMKELEMMDVTDMEHMLDVEEALHYYSRLRSPAYLDIVDKFFMDMYSELSLSHASANIKSSKRRLGSIRL